MTRGCGGDLFCSAWTALCVCVCVCAREGERVSLMRASGDYLACCALLLVAVWLTYGDIVHHGFVNWDDNENYRENKRIQEGLSTDSLHWLVVDGSILGVYEPVSLFFKLTLSHFSTSMALSPRPFLVFNLFLHGCNTVLAFDTFASTASTMSAFVGGLVFAIHPLRAEPVCWASCLPYLLSCLFTLLSVRAHRAYPRGRNVPRTLFYALAMLSKIPAISLVGYFVVHDTFETQLLRTTRRKRSRVKPRAEHTVTSTCLKVMENHAIDFVVALFCAYTSIAANSVSESHGLTLGQKICRASYSLFWYLKASIAMDEPNIIYPVVGDSFSFTSLKYGSAVLAFSMLTGWAARRMWSRLVATWEHGNAGGPGDLLARYWLEYVVLMVPTLGLIQHGYLTMGADRYLYIPSAVVAVPCVCRTLDWFDQTCSACARRRVFATRGKPYVMGMLCVIGAIAQILVRQTRVVVGTWENSTEVWAHANNYISAHVNHSVSTKHAAFASEIVLNLADAHREAGDMVRSYDIHARALTLYNASAHGYNNFASLLIAMGKHEDAIKAGESALQIEPTMSEAMANIALAYNYIEKVNMAVAWYEKALLTADANIRTEGILLQKSKGKRVVHNPGFWLAYGNALEASRRSDGVVSPLDCFREAYKLDPLLPLVNEKLARYEDDSAKKLQFLRREVTYNPTNADAFFNLGNLYGKMGEYDEALDAYRSSLKIQPGATDAMINTAIIELTKKENCLEASRWAHKILVLSPSHRRAIEILKKCGTG